MTIGGEEVLNEHHLLAYTENGEMMDSPLSVRFLVIHCSATRADRNYTDKQLMRDHKQRGFRTVGYIFYVHKDGSITQFRKLLEVGSHARPYNRCSIGICYEGGLDAEGRAKDTRTEAQKISLSALVGELKERFPQALVVGHRELDPGKECPCFEMNKLRKCLEFYKKELSLQTVKTCKT